MKPLSAELRRKIETLRKTLGNNAEPNWQLDIYRDREKMLGLIDGAAITTGADTDVQPAVSQASVDKVYHVVFERSGQLYYMTSSATNTPTLTWSAPALLFAGTAPDVEFYGSFTTTGRFNTTDLLCVYENPAGTVLFRRRDSAGVWGAAVQIGAGENASLVRGWADPPEVGTQDTGLVVFYTRSGQLYYRESFDIGVTWSAEAAVDLPAGGTKRNPQVFRLADYTLGVVYEYDNGISIDVYMLKTTRKYVNIASPDETVRAGGGEFRHFVYELYALGAPEVPEETVSALAQEYRHGTFDRFDAGGTSADETVSAGAGEYRQVEFTGVAP